MLIIGLIAVSLTFLIGLVAGISNPVSRRRSLAALVAWCLGGMIVLGASYEGGVPAMFLQPILAAAVGAIFVVLSLSAGLVIRIPRVHRLWHSTPAIAGAMVVVSLATMCVGSQLGLSELHTSMKTGATSVVLRSDVAIVAYSVLMFAIVNWPLGRVFKTRDNNAMRLFDWSGIRDTEEKRESKAE